MGMFDNAKEKAEQFATDNPDKVENASDQALDRAQDAAGGVGGGRFDEQAQHGRDALDQKIGE